MKWKLKPDKYEKKMKELLQEQKELNTRIRRLQRKLNKYH